MIKPAEFSCPVCCNQTNYSEAFSIGSCKHIFCQSCCIQHVQARLDVFENVGCLENNCSEKLTKQSKIYIRLSPQAKKKFAKYQQFISIQKNKNFKPCNNQQCFGLLDISRLVQKQKKPAFLLCNLCKAEHCANCYSLAHQKQQKCKGLSQEDKIKQEKLMKSLNYRRCPNCSIWVQKSGGCQYLVCKCKTQFCFVCGSKFQNDPCRKSIMYQIESQVRHLMIVSNYIKRPQDTLGFILFIPKLLLKFVLILLFTIFGGIVFMALAFGLIVPLVYLVAPASFIVMIGEIVTDKGWVCFLRILALLFYPVVGLIAAIVIFFFLATYPLMRILINSQLYDQIDKHMHQISSIYLRGVRCVLLL